MKTNTNIKDVLHNTLKVHCQIEEALPTVDAVGRYIPTYIAYFWKYDLMGRKVLIDKHIVEVTHEK